MLFPHPEGPTSDRNSPRASPNDTPESASTPLAKDLLTDWNESKGGAAIQVLPGFVLAAGALSPAGAATPRPLFTKRVSKALR